AATGCRSGEKATPVVGLASVAGLLLGHFPDADHPVLIPARQELSRRSKRERHYRVAVFFLECLLEVADPPVVLTVGRPRLPHIDLARVSAPRHQLAVR